MKYKLGIITPVHIKARRHDITLAWIDSMLRSQIYYPIKHVIINDGSEECGNTLLAKYQAEASTVQPNLHIFELYNEKRKGKWFLAKNFLQGLSEMKDCEYILSCPDDVLLNPWIFEAINVSLPLLEKVSGITFFKDIRANMWNLIPNHGNRYDNHFNRCGSCDGFLLVCKNKVFNEMVEDIDPDFARAQKATLIWRYANKNHLKGDILEYKESLSQHIGNPFSAMTNETRKLERFIYARDVNLWRKPDILGA